MANLSISRNKNDWSYNATSSSIMFHVKNTDKEDQFITEVVIKLGYGASRFNYGDVVQAGSPYVAQFSIVDSNKNNITSNKQIITNGVKSYTASNGQDTPLLNQLINYTFTFNEGVFIAAGATLSFTMNFSAQNKGEHFVVVKHNYETPPAIITSIPVSEFKYTIIYKDVLGNEIAKQEKKYGENCTLLDKISGQLLFEENEGSEVDDIEYQISIISWKDDDGKIYETPYSYEKNSDLILTTNFLDFPEINLPKTTRQKYKFLGWLKNNEIVENSYIPTEIIETLSASWEENKSIITFFDGTNWIQATPYIFDKDNKWKAVSPYVYDGKKWRMSI